MGKWYNKYSLDSKNYICGYCGSDITSKEGYFISDGENSTRRTGEGYIYICHCLLYTSPSPRDRG